MSTTTGTSKTLPTIKLGDRVHVQPAAALDKPYEGKVERLLLPSGTPLTEFSAHVAPHSIVRVETGKGKTRDALWGVDLIEPIADEINESEG